MCVIKLLIFLVTSKTILTKKCYQCNDCAQLVTSPALEANCQINENYCAAVYYEAISKINGGKMEVLSRSCEYIANDNPHNVDWDDAMSGVCGMLKRTAPENLEVVVCKAKFCQQELCNTWCLDTVRGCDNVFDWWPGAQYRSQSHKTILSFTIFILFVVISTT